MHINVDIHNGRRLAGDAARRVLPFRFRQDLLPMYYAETFAAH